MLNSEQKSYLPLKGNPQVLPFAQKTGRIFNPIFWYWLPVVSTGDGYRFAAGFGHTVVHPRPSLVPLMTKEQWPFDLKGLSLKNVDLKVIKDGRQLSKQRGEMLFTHFGVSGPLVLSASSIIADSPENTVLEIDLKPALRLDELDARILRDFQKYSRKQISNALFDLLPTRMVPVILKLAGIDKEKEVDQISRAERQKLASTLKSLKLTILSARPIEEAIVTRGGIPVSEINASTMESKLVKGLFFAGEIIDTDGFTGGFNLQIAYSTGALAGRCMI